MENLPVEIFHRIFDHLDIETLFFSIRPVCQLFRSIVLNYDRFHFHLKLSSKSHFDVLCQFIPPENIRSLTLYNNQRIPDQISPFLRQVRLGELTRLHSIDLDGIDGILLNYFLKKINLDLLRSCSIQMKNYYCSIPEIIAKHLSNTVKQRDLRHLHLSISNIQISEIEWPSNCSIQSLTLSKHFTFDHLVQIFSSSPQLYRLIIKENFAQLIHGGIAGYLFPQLRSLIIDQFNSTINGLESFLLSTPSLSYLKLMGTMETFDGKRWEDFIQVNLPHLNQFQFSINCRNMTRRTREDLELILQSFRSSFWIEHKKWFVCVEMNEEESNKYQISSIPIGKTIDEYQVNGKHISLSTSNEVFDNRQITEMVLRFPMSLSQSALMSMNIFDCSKLTKLCLYFDRKLSVDLAKISSTMINLSQLIEVKLESFYFNRDNEQVLCDMLKLLEHSSKLSLLIVHSHHYHYKVYPYLSGIFSNLPSQVNHLLIPIEEVTQIPTIFQRCSQLKVIQFPTKRTRLSEEVERWFNKNTNGSIFRREDQYDTIWIGQIREQNHCNRKRMKFDPSPS